MMLSMLFFVLATLTTVSSMLRGFYDLITAKNDGQWKIIWGIIIFVFSIIGLTAYMLKGRKERIS